MKVLIALVVSCSSVVCFAQSDTTFPVLSDSSVIFQRVEVEAYFPGGADAWKSFLEKNLRSDKVAKKAAPKKAKHWSQRALVKFMIEKDGSITNVEVINADSLHKEVVKECLRVFSLAPKWIPGTQNGRPVRSRHTQPLTFYLKEF
jgi:protein TonB